MTRTRRTDLLDPETLQRLVERADAPGLRALAIHLGLLMACGFGAALLPQPFAAVAWAGYAVLLVFLFCPLHEVIHETAFASRVLNRVTSYLCGLVLLLPPRYFRAFHLAHHRHTQLPEQDPELATPKPRGAWQYACHVSGIPYWIAQGRALVRNAAGRVEDFVPPSRRGDVILEARIYLLVYVTMLLASLAMGSTLLWWYWVLPVLAAQPLLRCFLLAEHTGCPEVPDMFDNTRTTFTNPLMRRLCWNMNFHTAHHAYAGIPFHRLAEANARIADNLRHVGQGYLRVNREILRFLAGKKRAA